MVTYEFYKDTYLGSALSETAFRQAAARAEHWLSMLERRCYVSASGPDSRALAVCALAEVMDRARDREQVKSASIGGVSVSFADDSHKKLQQRLLQAAGVYLDICRGVG